MEASQEPRNVKIGSDERTGWSSDRPRREGAPVRPPDVSVRGRVLRPTDRLRYSPGSLLVVVSASKETRDAFIARVVEARGSVISLDRVRGLLAGRVPDEEIEDRAIELLDATVAKRVAGGDSTVIGADGLEPEEREHYVRLAAPARRPRHLILLEVPNADVDDEQRPQLNTLRRALDGGALGGEGFHTALRLSTGSAAEVKRVVFRPEPRVD